MSTTINRADLEARLQATFDKIRDAETEAYTKPGGTKQLAKVLGHSNAAVEKATTNVAAVTELIGKVQQLDALAGHRAELERHLRAALSEAEAVAQTARAAKDRDAAAHSAAYDVGNEWYQAKLTLVDVMMGNEQPSHIDPQLRRDLKLWPALTNLLAWVAEKPGRRELVDVEAIEQLHAVITESAGSFVATIDKLLRGETRMGDVFPTPLFDYAANQPLKALTLGEFLAAIPELIASNNQRNPLIEHIVDMDVRKRDEVSQAFADAAALCKGRDTDCTALVKALKSLEGDIEFGWGPALDFSRIFRFMTFAHAELGPSIAAYRARSSEL